MGRGALSILLLASVAAAEPPGLNSDAMRKVIERAATGNHTLINGTVPTSDKIFAKLGGRRVPLGEIANEAEEERLGQRFVLLQNQTMRQRPQMDAPQEDQIDVLQHHAAITTYGTTERYLQSDKAGPCVLLTLYDPASKTAAMAHLHALSGVSDSIAVMLAEMGVTKGAKVQARLIGGQAGMPQIFLVAIKTLDNFGVAIMEVDTKVEGDPSDAIILDSQTGEVYDMQGAPPKESPERKAKERAAFGPEHHGRAVQIMGRNELAP
jgi:chemotaxis receptor (MCP) glutamine deamidase CheD